MKDDSSRQATALKAVGPSNNNNEARSRELAKTANRVHKLVSRILVNDDDDQGLALVALIAMIAYEREFVDRDCIAAKAMDHAYTLTPAFCASSSAFRQNASSWSKEIQ